MENYSAEYLFSFTKNVLQKSGFPEDVSDIAAGKLLQADLRGIDSHGVARLSGFVRLVKAGRINVNARPQIVHETLSTATMDADGGLGLWVAHEAMLHIIDKAGRTGCSFIAIRNSSHFGIAAAHAALALEHDMIGMAMTNASPLVAPAGASEAYLGTNPICIAVPAGKEKPFILDMATSAAANGKMEIAARKSTPIPQGWAQTREGAATTSAEALKEGGTLLPLGSDADHGYHKGYGLGAMVDIFSGVLPGANFGGWVPPFVAFLQPHANPVGKGIGHFLGAWQIDGFEPAHEFRNRMDTWIQGVKKLRKKEGVDEVLIPGEPEFRFEEERRRNGIPLIDKVVDDLKGLGQELGVPFEEA